MAVFHGVKHGVTHGVGHGIGSDYTVPGSPSDLLSGMGVPLTQAEVNTFLAEANMGAKTVAHSWGFQDASGNISATVGTLLTAAGTLEYQQAVSGWTRTATRFTDNTTDAASHAGGTGINPSTTSCLYLFYIDVITDVGALRNMVQGGGAVTGSELSYRRSAARLNAVKVMSASVAGTADPQDGGVRPCVLRYNRTAGTADIFNDQEKVVGTYNSGVTDGVKGVGAGIVNSGGLDVLWGLAFSGASAEWTDIEVRAFLQALGWSVAW